MLRQESSAGQIIQEALELVGTSDIFHDDIEEQDQRRLVNHLLMVFDQLGGRGLSPNKVTHTFSFDKSVDRNSNFFYVSFGLDEFADFFVLPPTSIQSISLGNRGSGSWYLRPLTSYEDLPKYFENNYSGYPEYYIGKSEHPSFRIYFDSTLTGGEQLNLSYVPTIPNQIDQYDTDSSTAFYNFRLLLDDGQLEQIKRAGGSKDSVRRELATSVEIPFTSIQREEDYEGEKSVLSDTLVVKYKAFYDPGKRVGANIFNGYGSWPPGYTDYLVWKLAERLSIAQDNYVHREPNVREMIMEFEREIKRDQRRLNVSQRRIF